MSPEFLAIEHMAAEILLKRRDIEIDHRGRVLVNGVERTDFVAGIGIMRFVITEYLGIDVQEIAQTEIDKLLRHPQFSSRAIKFKLLLDRQSILRRFPLLLDRYAQVAVASTAKAGTT